MSAATDCDLLVVGGGINGAGIARDAVGRGLDVHLVEQDDLASHTSSASTKLIHGGLRYLEQYELRLVREALAERERLLGIAPHIIRPMRFVLPYAPGMRPRWLLRLGLFVYDHLERREKLAASRELDLRAGPEHAALQPRYERGFEYSDCWVEDSRLVVLNALDAAERGANIHTRTRFLSAVAQDGRWTARCEEADGAPLLLRPRAIVNATGTWVNDVVGRCGLAPRARVRLVKGSHLVFPRLYEGEHAYLLQNPDRRVVFLIPFERDFTLVGTTDVPFEGDLSAPRISPEEITYLCDCVSRFLRTPVTGTDAVGSFSGVRPLHDDGTATQAQQVSRDYRLELQADSGAPLLSVYGGKITTYRRLAGHALSLLLPALGRETGEDWTGTMPLPGGDIADGNLARFTRESQQRFSGLDARLIARLARTYGTRLARIVGDARQPAQLGRDYGGGLTQRELDHLATTEWARTPQDVLQRRTRLGLRDAGGALARALAGYFSTNARSIT